MQRGLLLAKSDPARLAYQRKLHIRISVIYLANEFGEIAAIAGFGAKRIALLALVPVHNFFCNLSFNLLPKLDVVECCLHPDLLCKNDSCQFFSKPRDTITTLR